MWPDLAGRGALWQFSERWCQIWQDFAIFPHIFSNRPPKITKFQNFGIFGRFGKLGQHLTRRGKIWRCWKYTTRSVNIRSPVEFRNSRISAFLDSHEIRKDRETASETWQDSGRLEREGDIPHDPNFREIPTRRNFGISGMFGKAGGVWPEVARFGKIDKARQGTSVFALPRNPDIQEPRPLRNIGIYEPQGVRICRETSDVAWEVLERLGDIRQDLSRSTLQGILESRNPIISRLRNFGIAEFFMGSEGPGNIWQDMTRYGDIGKYDKMIQQPHFRKHSDIPTSRNSEIP